MGFRLAEAYVTIGARTSGFHARLRGVRVAMQRTYQKMQQFSQRAKRVLMIGAAAVGGVAFVFARFEKQMARVQAISGATEEEFKKLTAQARALGGTTEWSATQAAEGMTNLAMAGFKTNEILAAMPGLLALATAGNVDLAKASQVVADTLRGLGWEASRSEEIADIMAKTATSSSQTFEQLADAMSYAMAVGTKTGASFNEMNAAIAAMADRAIKGSRAGTSLAGIYARMSGAAQETTAFLKKLGVETGDASGNMRPLADIVADINSQMEGLGKKEKASRVMKAFGLRAGPGMLSLLAEGSKGLKEFEKSLEDAGGTAQRIAEIQLATLAGRFKILVSTIQEFMLVIGSHLEPLLSRLVNAFQSIVAGMNKLNTGIVRSVIEWVAVAAASTGVVLAITAMAAAFITLASPMMFAVAAAAALVVWYVKANVETRGLAGTFVWFSDVVGNAVDFMLQWWARWANTILSGIAWVKTALTSLADVFTWLGLKIVLFINTTADDWQHWAAHMVKLTEWFMIQHNRLWSNAERFWGHVIHNMQLAWANYWIWIVAKIKGVDWELTFRPLTAGYEHVMLDAIPQMTRRAVSEIENELANGIAAIQEKLGVVHKQKFEQLLKVWGPDAARKVVMELEAAIAAAKLTKVKVPAIKAAIATVRADSAFVGIVAMARKIQESAYKNDPVQQQIKLADEQVQEAKKGNAQARAGLGKLDNLIAAVNDNNGIQAV